MVKQSGALHFLAALTLLWPIVFSGAAYADNNIFLTPQKNQGNSEDSAGKPLFLKKNNQSSANAPVFYKRNIRQQQEEQAAVFNRLRKANSLLYNGEIDMRGGRTPQPEELQAMVQANQAADLAMVNMQNDSLRKKIEREQREREARRERVKAEIARKEAEYEAQKQAALAAAAKGEALPIQQQQPVKPKKQVYKKPESSFVPKPVFNSAQ